MSKIDFEFVSTHRNRSLWRNPCTFEVPWSGSGQRVGLNAADPVSDQTPLIEWVGQNIAISATVVSRVENSVVVSTTLNSLSKVKNYYVGAELKSTRINSSMFLGSTSSADFMQLSVIDCPVQTGDAVTVTVSNVPNTVFVPHGSDSVNAYNDHYLYNDTRRQYVAVRGYDSTFHKIIASIPTDWSITDNYCIRQRVPGVKDFVLGSGNTITTLNLTGIVGTVTPGDFIRVVKAREIVKVIDYKNGVATVHPELGAVHPVGTIIEVMTTTSDNYRTMSYSGTVVGQHEQVAYEVNLVSGTVPNRQLKKGGGYPSDHPFLYVEFYDTNLPSQNNMFSNNHANKSMFKVTTPTGQLLHRNEKFTKVTGDLNHKLIRFRPTSNFKVCWRLPSGDELEFVDDDSFSPQIPIASLQTSLVFSLKRCDR